MWTGVKKLQQPVVGIIEIDYIYIIGYNMQVVRHLLVNLWRISHV
jgi:hypothetical protein